MGGEARRLRRQAQGDDQVAGLEHGLPLRRVAGQAVELLQRDLAPAAWPSISTTASSATSGTQKSDGCVAMQLSLQPSTACSRFSPPRASQPEPGSRLLQALAMS